MSDPSDLVQSAVDRRGVATLTLNRPERYNAYDERLIDELVERAGVLGRDPAIRVVVLRGNGKHFQAGADVGWLQRLGSGTLENSIAASRKTTEAMRALNALPRPTVALVHGACYGGGVGLVACCDVVIATEGASFALSEVRIGVVPTPIVPQMCAALGVRGVRRYGLSGERFGSREAHRMGLVHEVCPEGGLDQAAGPLIDALLRSAPEAVAATKASILQRTGLEIGDQEVEALAAQSAVARASPEAREGLASFLEKRDPSWYSES